MLYDKNVTFYKKLNLFYDLFITLLMFHKVSFKILKKYHLKLPKTIERLILYMKSFHNFIKNKFFPCITAGLLTSCLLFTSTLTTYASQAAQPQTPEERLELQRNMPIQSNEIPNWPVGPIINAESGILMDADTGTILYAKNIHEKEFPASTTKILTSLIAAETCSMDEIVTFSQSAIYDTPYDSSHIAMDVGEELTMEQALNAILIASANEVSFAVGEHISGTWQEFAELMNQKAKELGCIESHFVNPNGLPDDNHYTSAYDLATIGRAFFSNELLCTISSTKQLHIPPSEKQPDDIIEYSKNQLFEGRKYEYEYLVGSKTGYTNAARNCLVSCAEKDGMKLVCVVFKDESPLQFEDTVSLFNYGFSNFDKVNISQTETKYNINNADSFYSNNDIFGSSKPLLSLNAEDSIIVPKTIPFEDITSAISYENTTENQAAIITYTYQDIVLGTASIDLVITEEETYSFETTSITEEENLVLADKNPSEETTENTNNTNVIFINVINILLWIVGGIILLAVCAGIWFLIKHYHKPKHSRNNRRNWQREQRKRQNHYQSLDESFILNQKNHLQHAKVKRRKIKRTNNTNKKSSRDYDF